MTSSSHSPAHSIAKPKQRKNKSKRDRSAIIAHTGFQAELAQYAPWESWAKKLAKRKVPAPLHKLFTASKAHPLEWSLTSSTPEATSRLVAQLVELKRQKKSVPADWTAVADEWLERIPGRRDDHFAVECLAWVYALPRLAIHMTGDSWWKLAQELMKISVEAMGSPLPVDDAEYSATSWQMLAGELPLAFAYLFPKVKACKIVAAPARVVIGKGLSELLDGEGLPHARVVTQWRTLLATWTRAIAIDREIAKGKIDDAATIYFEWFLRQSISARRDDGGFVFEPPGGGNQQAHDLLSAAVELFGDPADRDLLACVNHQLKPDESEFVLPLPAVESEWAQLAILRSDWTRRSPLLAITYPGNELCTEFSAGRELLWQHESNPEVVVDQQRLTPVSSWSQLGWTSDKDMDYLELELPLNDGWVIQRQVVLAREDGFMFVADAVIGRRPAQIAYRRVIPWSADLQVEDDDQHTETTFHGNHLSGCALPLELSEWRSVTHEGQFRRGELEQHAHGQAIYAPVFFDLDRKRVNKPRTWRRLTVGQDLQIVRRDQAVAYRVQIGSKQWIVYRSLEKPAGRTFLGQNLSSEFLVARFLKTGDIEPLVEIEAP